MIKTFTYNLVFALLLVSFVVVSGCFITNCPPGGKRSSTEFKPRQCEQCGPTGLKGRCYGTQICCSPEFGCLFSTPDTYACQLENRFPTPCVNPGVTCGGNGDSGQVNGQCATEGVCCSTETCTLDDTCHDEAASSSSSSFLAPVSSLMHKELPSSSSLNGGSSTSLLSKIGKHHLNQFLQQQQQQQQHLDNQLVQYRNPLDMVFHRLITSNNNGHSLPGSFQSRLSQSQQPIPIPPPPQSLLLSPSSSINNNDY